MTLFLRNQDNDTILDVEIYKTKGHVELHSSIIIDKYSKFLLINQDKAMGIIRDFTMLSELRGCLWERYLGTNNTEDRYEEALERVQNIMKDISNKYKLTYLED